MRKGYLTGSLTRYAECWSYLGQAERTARELGLTTLVAESCGGKGMISTFMSEHAAAENCLNSALAIATEAQERSFEGLITAGLAKSVMYRGEYVEAVQRFERALAIFGEFRRSFLLGDPVERAGQLLFAFGRAGKSSEFFQRAEQVFLESGATPNYQVCLASIWKRLSLPQRISRRDFPITSGR